MSLLIHEAKHRLKENSLIKLTDLIDWQAIRSQIKLGRSGLGPQGYDEIQLLKALILQNWHSLSDVELEEALRVRLDFMVITQFKNVPDATTICRFRSALTKLGLWDKILTSINEQLEGRGLKVKKSQGAIVDATIITSAGRPQKEIEVITVDRLEEETTQTIKETLSKDTDACWLKKGNKSYFGYKAFAVADEEDGFLDQIHVTPAHMSETKELETILKKAPKLYAAIKADKAYASKDNDDLLRVNGITNHIMKKAARNRPLTEDEKVFNKMVSRMRYKIEQAFGTLKRRFKLTKASYFGVEKVHAQLVLKAIAFNLLKAGNMLVAPPRLHHQSV